MGRLLRLTYRESNTQKMAEAGVAAALLEYLKAVPADVFEAVRPSTYQLIVRGNFAPSSPFTSSYIYIYI